MDVVQVDKTGKALGTADNPMVVNAQGITLEGVVTIPDIPGIGATNGAAVTDPTATATLVQLMKGLIKVLSQDGIKRIEQGVSISGRDTALSGKVAVAAAGTPVSLGSQACGEGVLVQANPANTGNVYVFPTAGAKTDVAALAPGEWSPWTVSNLSALKVDADTNGDSVFWRGAI